MLFLIIPLLFLVGFGVTESFAETSKFLTVMQDQSQVSGASSNSAQITLVDVNESSLSQDIMNITVW